MKNIITILILFVAVGCGKTEVETETIPETKTEKTEKPLIPEEKLIGSYEIKKDGETYKLDLLENGKYESWAFGKKKYEGTWKIVGKEVHVVFEGFTEVFKIEQNGDLTFIARIEDSKRTDEPKEDRETFKKLKE